MDFEEIINIVRTFLDAIANVFKMLMQLFNGGGKKTPTNAATPTNG